jgi:hypothetical protein
VVDINPNIWLISQWLSTKQKKPLVRGTLMLVWQKSHQKGGIGTMILQIWGYHEHMVPLLTYPENQWLIIILSILGQSHLDNPLIAPRFARKKLRSQGGPLECWDAAIWRVENPGTSHDQPRYEGPAHDAWIFWSSGSWMMFSHV